MQPITPSEIKAEIKVLIKDPLEKFSRGDNFLAASGEEALEKYKEITDHKIYNAVKTLCKEIPLKDIANYNIHKAALYRAEDRHIGSVVDLRMKIADLDVEVIETMRAYNMTEPDFLMQLEATQNNGHS
jgi:hypothetical protein